jgi:hypothetical protein
MRHDYNFMWHDYILLGGMIRMIRRMSIMLCGMNACAALGRVYTLGPELHKDLSTLHSPVLHLDVFPPQEPDLHLDIAY